jgi:hypothetical protein
VRTSIVYEHLRRAVLEPLPLPRAHRGPRPGAAGRSTPP